MTTDQKWQNCHVPVPVSNATESDLSVIVKQVAWHRGGATIDGKPGEPWPWEGEPHSNMEYLISGEGPQPSVIWKSGWQWVWWYCDPADLLPPTDAGRGSV